MNQSDPFQSQQGPVIVPPQGNPQGAAPGAVKLFFHKKFVIHIIFYLF